MAFGAAGPLMLPAILDDVSARRVIVPPYPGLFSALGLLSSDLVYTESRSAYVVLSHDAADGRQPDLPGDGGLRPRAAAAGCDRRRGAPHASTAGSSASRGTRRSSRCRAASWTPPRSTGVIAAFHDEYESRYGNRFEQFPVEGVTYRVQLALGSDKVQYPKIERGETAEIAPDRVIELST